MFNQTKSESEKETIMKQQNFRYRYNRLCPPAISGRVRVQLRL
ncbi:Uncharacterised protein [Catenibacterium mitsuokai]|nr:Uncharacterised protein [Catenibacterium mitsuokai]